MVRRTKYNSGGKAYLWRLRDLQSAHSEVEQLGFRTIGRRQESSRVLRYFIEAKGPLRIYMRSVSFEKNRSGLEIQLMATLAKMAFLATPRYSIMSRALFSTTCTRDTSESVGLAMRFHTNRRRP